MACEFVLCIYQENGECVLRDVNINSHGVCESAVAAVISPEVLKAHKIETMRGLFESSSLFPQRSSHSEAKKTI